MSAVVDTDVLIDALRGSRDARSLLARESAVERLHASEVTRLELLAGMRPSEVQQTRNLLGALLWHPLDEAVAERAGALARQWRSANRGIGASDFAIAATAELLDARLLTRNVKHFPMFDGLAPPY